MHKMHIILEEGQKLFFTSDLHFGHRNVLKFAGRPWESEKEMGPALISNWNSVVSDKDIVFILGDVFWFNDSKSIKKVLGQLQGKYIYILPGNHDDFEHYYRVEDPRIHLLPDVVQIWVSEPNQKKQEIILCHYPLATYPHRANGAFQFFGHIHSGPNSHPSCDIIGKDLFIDESLQVDVGTDRWNYFPVEYSTLKKYLLEKSKEVH